jgi:biopolymer transport protein ExbB
MQPAESLTTMSFANFLRETDAVGLFVFALLIVMSIISWFFIILKAARVVRIRSGSSHVVSSFWKTEPEQAIAYLEQQPEWEPFSKIALDGEFAMHHYDHLTTERTAGTLRRAEFLDRALRAAADREMERLETGLTFLASVGSTAPFVGLFGTVWGIFHALVRIGATGETSLDQVAGPVGEALIMTALGLAVAVPAVMGYNLLVATTA